MAAPTKEHIGNTETFGVPEIMNYLGIDSNSRTIYLPNALLRNKVSSPQKTDILFGAKDRVLILENKDRDFLGSAIVSVDDLFEKAFPRLSLSEEERKGIVENASELSKWALVLESTINPVQEDKSFYLTRLLVANRIFILRNAERVFTIKTMITESMTKASPEMLSIAEAELTNLVANFSTEYPEFFQYFGISEDYLYNITQAQLLIPSLVGNRNYFSNSDKLSKEILQHLFQEDPSILTAFMMGRTIRYFTGEEEKVSNADTKIAQIISATESPPKTFIASDNARRSEFANMWGIYQDTSYGKAYPEVFSLGDTVIRKKIPNMEYLSRMFFLTQILPAEIGFESFSHFDVDSWTELSAKSVISSVRKAASPFLPQIKKLSDRLGYEMPKTDLNMRIDLFDRLGFILKKADLKKVGGLVNQIKLRIENTELVRFRWFLGEEDFDKYIDYLLQKGEVLQIVTDIYSDGKNVNSKVGAKQIQQFEPGTLKPSESLRLTKEKLLKKASQFGENPHVFISILYRKDIKRDGSKIVAELQSSLIETLRDNWDSRKFYFQ
jgi:hypothetical protein